MRTIHSIAVSGSLVFASVLAAVALASLPGAALAGAGCGGFDVVSHIFDASDTDGNGSLSRQEYADAGLERYGVSFDEYDADGNGETSFDEYLDLYDLHHPAGFELES